MENFGNAENRLAVSGQLSHGRLHSVYIRDGPTGVRDPFIVPNLKRLVHSEYRDRSFSKALCILFASDI